MLSLAEYIRPSRIKPGHAMPFNHRVVDGAFLITNDLGDWYFLEPDDFRRFIEGEVGKEDPLYAELAKRNFIAAEVDIAAQALRYRGKKHFLAYGPTLHAFVLTERCNHGCQYCHSSIVGMKRMDTDMPIDVAEKGVDMALQTTAPWLNIEFQGGEPTAAWDVLSHIVKYAQQQNKAVKKDLSFSLVTNFSLMTDERLDFLLENKVQVCTSLDGPEDLHNRIRIFKGGNSHAIATHWIKKVNQRYVDMGLDPTLYRIEALPTVTRYSLHRWKDIVDQYVELGCRAIFLRKLDPFGFAAHTSDKLGYHIDEFIEFFINALEYILELNKQGVEVMERHAAIMLSKIIADYEPNYLDLRTPGGAAIGQVGYHPDGRIFSSDEGRMVAAMGDDMFQIGTLGETSYQDMMSSDVVRSLVYAGTNDSHVDCTQCTYKVYCGQQPEYNYISQGSLHGRMRDSVWCKKHKKIFDHLALKLRRADPEDMKTFERWTTNRAQTHFLQDEE